MGYTNMKVRQIARRRNLIVFWLMGRIAILAYAAALRLAFMSAILFFIIVNLLILPVKLPRLGKEKVAADVEDN
jgi:hypothetical protein